MKNHEIGTIILTAGTKKVKGRVQTVVDVLTTYTSTGALYDTRYVTEYDFLGSKMRDSGHNHTSISIGAARYRGEIP